MAGGLQVRQRAAVGTLMLAMLAATPAHAQAAGGQGTLTAFLQNLVNLITGTAGQLIAVIAVAIAGLAALFGAISVRQLGGTVLGIMLIFSSSWIVSQIAA
ncbi:hypothetical protein IP88_04170 [alpha proteobacterium AAP81b]|nr:hypothetical protein IP88_04170 [alpha proteobacterium AAP81b]